MSVSIAPPDGISAAARLATSVKEKAERTIVRDEISADGVGVAAFEFVAVGKADAMDEEIEMPQVGNRREHGVDGAMSSTSHGRTASTEALGQRRNALRAPRPGR